MSKLFASVSEMLHELHGPNLAAAFDRFAASRKIINELQVRRAVRGLSDRDIAKKLRWTQRRLALFEESEDGEVLLGDVLAYAKVLGCKITVA